MNYRFEKSESSGIIIDRGEISLATSICEVLIFGFWIVLTTQCSKNTDENMVLTFDHSDREAPNSALNKGIDLEVRISSNTV